MSADPSATSEPTARWERGITTLEDAEAFFRALGCSHFHAAREYPERLEEYRRLGVSWRLERTWTLRECDAILARIDDEAMPKDELWLSFSGLTDLMETLWEGSSRGAALLRLASRAKPLGLVVSLVVYARVRHGNFTRVRGRDLQDLVRRATDALTRVKPRVPPPHRILVAEEIVGRRRVPDDGLLVLAGRIGAIDDVRRLDELVPAFCDGKAAPHGGPSVGARRAKVMGRLQFHRDRLRY